MTNPTFERFLAEHYHEIFGLVCESATAGRKGGELSLWMTQAGQTLKRRLRAMFDDLAPADKPGPVTPTPTKRVGV